MGIQSFLEISIGDNKKISDLGTNYGEEFMRDKCIAVDASIMIYRARFAIGNALSHNEKITSHIVIAFNMINKFNKFNVGQIWVFDGAVDELKRETIEKRNSKSRLTREEVADIKKLLLLSGIPAITVNVEAEFYCAELQRQGVVNFVYTSDTDVIVRGGTLVKDKKIDGRKTYYCLESSSVCEALNVSLEDLARIGVILGSDFAEKTKGVGPATVIKKYKNIVLTEKQERALIKLTKSVDLKTSIIERVAKKANIEQLTKWFISMNFSEKTISRINYK